MKDRWYKFFDIIFYIMALIMMCDFGARADEWGTIICLWIFILYFAWYDIYAKNKKLAIIPLWMYVIGYYAVYWDSICEGTKAVWRGIFG